jgi:hypothetical protein
MAPVRLQIRRRPATRLLRFINTSAAPHKPPAALSAIPWEKAKTIAAEGHATFDGNWEQLTAANGPSCRRFGKNFYTWFPHLYRTGAPGASVTVRFRGTHIGIKGMEGPDSGIVSIRMDDKPAVKQTLFTVCASAWVYVGAPLPAVSMGETVVFKRIGSQELKLHLFRPSGHFQQARRLDSPCVAGRVNRRERRLIRSARVFAGVCRVGLCG